MGGETTAKLESTYALSIYKRPLFLVNRTIYLQFLPPLIFLVQLQFYLLSIQSSVYPADAGHVTCTIHRPCRPPGHTNAAPTAPPQQIVAPPRLDRKRKKTQQHGLAEIAAPGSTRRRRPPARPCLRRSCGLRRRRQQRRRRPNCALPCLRSTATHAAARTCPRSVAGLLCRPSAAPPCLRLPRPPRLGPAAAALSPSRAPTPALRQRLHADRHLGRRLRGPAATVPRHASSSSRAPAAGTAAPPARGSRTTIIAGFLLPFFPVRSHVHRLYDHVNLLHAHSCLPTVLLHFRIAGHVFLVQNFRCPL